MFGWWGPGWGWRRWLAAQAYGDPARAYFGLGPCGEIAYQMYRAQGQGTLTPEAKEAIRAEIEALKRRIEELEKLLKD